MKLRKGWQITTSHGDEIEIVDGDYRNRNVLKWAKRNGYSYKRILILR